jgi:hypothetical protein
MNVLDPDNRTRFLESFVIEKSLLILENHIEDSIFKRLNH